MAKNSVLKQLVYKQPEPLLLVVPVILASLYLIAKGGSNTGNPIAGGTIMELTDTNLFRLVFCFIAAPLLLHFLLRKSEKWQATVCRPHVYITLLIVLILFTLQMNLPDTAEPLLANQQVNEITLPRMYTVLFLVGAGVQLLFTAFFLYAMFKKAY